jgi:Fe-S-cluster-containing dehydrogenase component
MCAANNKRAERIAPETTEAGKVTQVGLFFDQTRCTGCYACSVACKDWHDIPAGPVSWMRVSTIEQGKYPDPFLAFNVNLCHHCVSAPCLAACPVEAIQKREENGIVVVDREKCLGRDECGYPCSRQCPAGSDVLGFVSLVGEGKYAEAWRLIVDTNPFPGVCGRICAHPCESVCNRGQVDEPVAIQALERFVSEYIPAVPPFTIERKKQRVAVVGSDPDGLSCAYHLVRRGYRVTVFEALPVAGGMLRDIPGSRLPAEIVEREIAFIKALGVEIRTNIRIGQNLCAEQLDRFDAIFLAVSANKEKQPDIQGVPIQKVVSGVDFLRRARSGGDTAFSEGRVAVAIGLGRRAALAIDRLLRGLSVEESAEKQPALRSKIIDTDFIEKKDRIGVPDLRLSEMGINSGEVDGTDSGGSGARMEANRCLQCRGMCFVACPYNVPQFGAEDNPKMQKCDFCLAEWEQGKKPICVRSCTMRALDAGPIEALRIQHGDVRQAVGFSRFEKSDPAVVFKPKAAGLKG